MLLFKCCNHNSSLYKAYEPAAARSYLTVWLLPYTGWGHLVTGGKKTKRESSVERSPHPLIESKIKRSLYEYYHYQRLGTQRGEVPSSSDWNKDKQKLVLSLSEAGHTFLEMERAVRVHRRRINTEEKAKVIASVWGEELIQFLAA